MPTEFRSLSTDQVAALVELARQGSLRGAAEAMHLSQQGLRSRLLALENRLGIALYDKRRGMRRSTPLTSQGRQFLPHAQAFLQRSRELCELFQTQAEPREVRIAASPGRTHFSFRILAVFRDRHCSIRREDVCDAGYLSRPALA